MRVLMLRAVPMIVAVIMAVRMTFLIVMMVRPVPVDQHMQQGAGQKGLQTGRGGMAQCRHHLLGQDEADDGRESHANQGDN